MRRGARRPYVTLRAWRRTVMLAALNASRTPLSVKQIGREVGLDLTSVLMALGDLELMGAVVRTERYDAAPQTSRLALWGVRPASGY